MKNKILPVILLFNILMFFNACDLLNNLLNNSSNSDQTTLDQTNGLTGSYFYGTNLSNPAFERVDKQIDFNWEEGSPGGDMGVDEFSVRWTGYVKPKYSQQYTFYTNSDDGVKLWINGQLVINNWSVHPETEDTGKISLEANKKYSIKLEYYESYGGAIIQLFWSSQSESKKIIPYSCFFTDSVNGDDSVDDDNSTGDDSGDAEIKGAILLAGQSNMEGNVPSDFYNNILDLIITNSGTTLKSKLITTIKDWYMNYDNGSTSFVNSDQVNVLEAQELVRLKNENIVGDFLRKPRSDVWCSFNSNSVSRLKEGFGKPIGPELTLGQYLGNKADTSISLIKIAHGGTTLYSDWLSPTAAARLGKPTGPLYKELKKRIATISSNPNSINPDTSCDWTAFVWFQGENDCFDKNNAQTYEKNLKDLIADVRNEIGNKNLPVVIVELNYWAQTLTFGNMVKTAQNNVAATDNKIELVKINDLSQYYHMDPGTHFIIGERIGKSLEKLFPK